MSSTGYLRSKGMFTPRDEIDFATGQRNQAVESKGTRLLWFRVCLGKICEHTYFYTEVERVNWMVHGFQGPSRTEWNRASGIFSQDTQHWTGPSAPGCGETSKALASEREHSMQGVGTRETWLGGRYRLGHPPVVFLCGDGSMYSQVYVRENFSGVRTDCPQRSRPWSWALKGGAGSGRAPWRELRQWPKMLRRVERWSRLGAFGWRPGAVREPEDHKRWNTRASPEESGTAQQKWWFTLKESGHSVFRATSALGRGFS